MDFLQFLFSLKRSQKRLVSVAIDSVFLLFAFWFALLVRNSLRCHHTESEKEANAQCAYYPPYTRQGHPHEMPLTSQLRNDIYKLLLCIRLPALASKRIDKRACFRQPAE